MMNVGENMYDENTNTKQVTSASTQAMNSIAKKTTVIETIHSEATSPSK